MTDHHGITYTVENVKTCQVSVQDLREQNIRYVHIYWVDLANIRRNRILPIEYFMQLLESNRPGISLTSVALGFVQLMVAEGMPMTGEDLYALDMSSLRILSGVGPDGGKVGAVLGRFEQKNTLKLGKEVKICPRTLLGRLVHEAKSQYSTEFLVGFESEFIMLKSTKPLVASNIHQWSTTTALLSGSTEAVIMREIADAMRVSHIPLQMYHAEAAPGQYEIVSGPLTPLEAADALIYTREIIVNVSARHGLHATFAPRPFDTVGSATHGHISVHTIGETKIPDKLCASEEQFLAGVLDHLPAIAAFTLPTPGSYKRVGDGLWSGGTYVSYGNENRESPVRLTNAASPGSRNFEMRFIDGTANPYLALAAVLAGCIIGLRKKQVLEVESFDDVFVANLTEEQRKAKGVTKRMPLNVEQARRYLSDDTELREVLGEEMVQVFLSVNRTLEKALMQDADDNEQRTRLVEFY